MNDIYFKVLSHIANPWACSKPFTLHPRQFISTPSRHLWAMTQLMHQDYSFTYPPLSVARYSFIQLSELSVARYSFIQLSELEQRGVNKITKASKRQQKDLNPDSLE